MSEYINNNTSGIVDESKIIGDTDNGYIISTVTSWKLVPKNTVTVEPDYKGYYDEEVLPFRESETDLDPYLTYSNTANTTFTEKAERRFGFRNLQICSKKTAPVSGILSRPIDVSDTSYITVNGEISGLETGTVELSVIDNIDEVPILCEDTRQVHKEKLFFAQPTRFQIDPDMPLTLYEDNIICKKDMDTLSSQEFQEHTYALSYTAAGDPFRYFPVSKSIQIKILIRQYVDTAPFVSVQNMIVHRHGETLQWNSKA